MTTLVVLLPAIPFRNTNLVGEHKEREEPVHYALFDRRGQIVQSGECALDALPKAQTAVLILSARDTLLLEASLPPVTGPKLRKLLPNVVEEFLIDDAQRSHIAVAPGRKGEANRVVAVVERERFAAVVQRFAALGYGQLRAVPLVHCMPSPEHEPPDDAHEAHESHDTRREPELAPGDDEDANEASLLAGETNARHASRHAGVLIVRRAPLAQTTADTGSEAEAHAAAAVLMQTATQEQAAYVNGDEPRDNAVAASVEHVGPLDSIAAAEPPQRVELAIRQGPTGFGMEVSADRLDTTIAELARRGTLQVWALTATGVADATGEANEATTAARPATKAQDHAHSASMEHAIHRSGPSNSSQTSTQTSVQLSSQTPPHSAFPLAAQTFAWAHLARNALACPFDLCQFEFAYAGRGAASGHGGLRPWWPAIALVVASVGVSVAAVNVQWWQLSHRQDALNAQMTALVKDAFPGVTLVLDPHTQMQVELKRLRGAAGDLRPDDYLVLAAALSRALGPIPSRALATLDYSDGALAVTFKPETAIDGDGLRRRLVAQGISTREDNGKWLLGSLNSTTRAPR